MGDPAGFPHCPVERHCRQGLMNACLETGDLAPCLPYFKKLARLDKAGADALSTSQPPADEAGRTRRVEVK